MKYLPLKGSWVLSHSSGTSILGMPIVYVWHHEFRGHHTMHSSLPYPVVLMSQQKGGWTSVSRMGGGSLIPKGIFSNVYLPKLQSRPQLCSHMRRSSVVSYHLKHREEFKQPPSIQTEMHTFLLERDDELVASLGACLNADKVAVCPLHSQKQSKITIWSYQALMHNTGLTHLIGDIMAVGVVRSDGLSANWEHSLVPSAIMYIVKHQAIYSAD